MITDDEIARIAKATRMEGYPDDYVIFAHAIYKIGRQHQRESDAALFANDPSMENFGFVAEAILANTGELK